MKTQKKKFFTKGKIIIILALVAVISVGSVLLFSCGGNDDFNKNPNMDLINSTFSTALPTPTDGSTPDEHDAKTNAFYSVYAMSKLNGFSTVSTGESVTSVAVMNVSQKIKSKRFVSGTEIYKESISHSSFKSVGVRTFVKGDNYVIHSANKVSSVDNTSWSAKASRISKDSYLEKYGFVANNISGYVLNEESILNAEYLGENNGIYTFRYSLDVDKATGKLALEMRTMSGSQSLPIFERANLIVKMDKNWLVTETKTDSVYKVDMLGGVTCTESLTETFSHHNEKVDIPDVEFYRSYLKEEVSDPVVEELTATDYIMKGLEDYLTGVKPIKAKLNVESSSIPLSLNANVQANLNLEELENLSLVADVESFKYDDITLNNVLLGYNNKTIYMKAGELKASATFEQIGSLIEKIKPLLGDDFDFSLDSLSDISAESILENATLEKGESIATVTLPIDLGEISINAVLTFDDGEKIALNNVEATIGDVTITVTLDDEIEVQELGEGYNSIATLLDIIDNDGNIKAQVNIGDISALVNFNIYTLELDATIENLEIEGISLGKVDVKYASNTIYFNVKGLKGKLSLNDLDSITEKLAPLFGDETTLPDLNAMFNNIDVKELLTEIIDGISVQQKDNALTINTTAMDMPVWVILNQTEQGYSLGELGVEVDKLSLTACPTDKTVQAISNDDLNSYHNIATLLDIIDANNNINLTVEIGNENLDVTFNLLTMDLFASIAGAEIYVDIQNQNIYARYPGVLATASFDEIPQIIDALTPIINKFAGENALASFDLNAFDSINVEDVISSIKVINKENSTSISANINSIKLSAQFDTSTNAYLFDNAVVCFNDVEICATQAQTALSFEFDLSKDYIRLVELVADLAPALTDVLTSESLSASMTASLKMNNSLYEITECKVDLVDIYGATKANATLTLVITTTNEDGSVKTSTHKIRLVYLDPSLVSTGEPNTYFTYDNTANTQILEGTFTTTKANETLEILKEIYKAIPELQNALNPLIVPDSQGNPSFAKLSVDLKTIFNAITYKDNVLTADVNGNSINKNLNNSIIAQIANVDGALKLDIPELKFGDATLSLSANVGKPQDGAITDQTFSYTVGANASDFSSINELLEALKNTADERHFYIDGQINMTGLLSLTDKVFLDVYIDVVDGKTYVEAQIERLPHSILGISVWQDYKGTSTLYYDPVDEMIYMHLFYVTEQKKLTWTGIKYTYTNHDEYLKYTVDEFLADPITIIFKMIRLNSTFENEIIKAINEGDSTANSTATIENTLLNYSYDEMQSTFTIALDFKPLIGDIRETSVKIKHDENNNLVGLDVNADIIGILDLSLSTTLTTSQSSYGADQDVLAQKTIPDYK